MRQHSVFTFQHANHHRAGGHERHQILEEATLAVLSPDELRTAIATENLVLLTKVPGIGRKGAQRMVIELKDKINATALPEAPVADAPDGPAPAWREQVAAGLQGLGWSVKDADAACERVAPLAESEPSVAVLMRAALQTLARK